MKISYKWLREHLKTNCTPEELAQKLRVASCEVEDIEDWSLRLAGLVIGHVEKVQPHPQADRLRIATVKIGSKKRTIVCGAPNLAEDQKVIVALPGVTIHPLKGEPITIQETDIRGQGSEGMLCGADEIGLQLPSKDRYIMVLDSKIPSGSNVAEALGLDDTVLDLEITPNRPDLLSYRGIAREVGALDKKSLQDVQIASLAEKDSSLSTPITVQVDDTKLCQRYSAICLNNITIEPSPQWLQSRLLLSGIRPVNNVVDVTNYVMLELGQPLHVFDLDVLLHSPHTTLKLRGAHANERIITLDGIDRKLEPGDIIIADPANNPIDLAGIMGSKSSEVSHTTTQILIESAHFYGPQIRRTSRRLGLRSEASTRFEKGLDPEQTVTALKRAIFLLQEISQAKVASPLIDQNPRPRKERPRIHVSFARINQILGINISAAEAKTILQYLGFQIPSLTKSSFEAVPPTWRQDVSIPEDIMEELIRIWGFDRLPTTLPTGQIKTPFPNRFFEDTYNARRTLSAEGLHECIHVSLTSAADLTKIKWDPSTCVKLPNPLSAETEYLVPTHALHLIENCATVNIKETELGLFEIGHVFEPEETERLSLLLRSNQSHEHLYRSCKRSLIRLAKVLRVHTNEFSFEPIATSEAFYVEGSVLNILCQGNIIGEIGAIQPSICESFKIRSGRSLVFASLDLDVMLQLPKVHISYTPASLYPSIERDITAIIDETLPVQSLVDTLTKNMRELVTNWQVCDIFAGKPLPVGRKSVTVHFIYNDPNRTLSDDEVTTDQNRLIELLRQELQADIT